MTPGTLQNMVLLQLVGQAQGAPTAANFDLIILQHTDCGIAHLEHKSDLLAAYFGVDKTELGTKAIHDPYTAVAIDVAALKANPLLPATWSVSGLVYDVATGRVETVVPPVSHSL